MRERAQLGAWVRDARERTLDLLAGLGPGADATPLLPILNPLRWEAGHVGWFQERWVLRYHLGRAPRHADADRLWDSSVVAHDARWTLDLPGWADTARELGEIRDAVLGLLAGEVSPELAYLVAYTVFHEDMHAEAIAYTRQTLSQPAPRYLGEDVAVDAGPWPGDVEVPGGRFLLGARPGSDGFVFDNEKWAHAVEVGPFRIARAPVTAQEFAAFVEAGGYDQCALWSPAGWAWRLDAGRAFGRPGPARHPRYWRRSGAGWERRHFDRWVPLEPHHPVLHVSWYEAEAWCRWAGRRLPTEAEWEAAAAPRAGGEWAGGRTRYPWGDTPASLEQANLDGRRGGAIDVGALPAGDSEAGCRQMIGNVWEWTSSDFAPYPGFAPDMYADYSQPWFGTHKVLRGGCWVTRERLLRTSWRNFYPPDRCDVWAGFRTCAR